MRLRNLSRWRTGEKTEGLLFFAQRLDELLYDLTLDTHKAPALNAPSLCKEALELIDEIEKGFIEEANLDPVIEEIVWSLQQDDIAKALLDADVAYYTQRNEETPLATTKLRLEVLGRTINSNRYLDGLITRLSEAIEQSQKQKIDTYATSLVTSLASSGMSKQHLFNVTHDHFFSPEGDLIDSPKHFDTFKEFIRKSMTTLSIFLCPPRLEASRIPSLHLT